MLHVSEFCESNYFLVETKPNSGVVISKRAGSRRNKNLTTFISMIQTPQICLKNLCNRPWFNSCKLAHCVLPAGVASELYKPTNITSVASASLVVHALPYINLQPFVNKTRNVR